MGRHGSSAADKAAKEERLLHVAPLILQGLTQTEIADQLGVDQSTISRDITTLMTRWKKASLVDTDKRIAIQDRQYTEIIRAHLPKATNPADRGAARAAEIAMQAMAQQAKLLGLDQPAKQQIQMDMTRYQIVGVDDDDIAAALVSGAAE